MKFKFLLSASFLGCVFSSQAQNANKGFAITGDGNSDFAWMNIREVDLSNGKVMNTLFDRTKSTYEITDVLTKKSYNPTTINDGTPTSANMYPTASFVASAAFDKRSSKLFFIPMRLGQLRWMDVNDKSTTPKFYSIAIPGYVPNNYNEENNNITRMVIGADGYGYAVTNDGNHLYRFTTGKKPTVTDLGSLIDAETNNGLSIHNKCSSWGGDMIADAYGKLHIISATKNVFEIDVNTNITSYKGAISGLPANFTANGAAVTEDGNVVLSSAVAFVGYYKMNMKDLAATLVVGSDVKYNASDLASSNLLFQKEADASRAALVKPLVLVSANVESNIYPNPITNDNFNLSLPAKAQGVITVVVSDLAGRILQSNKVSVVKEQANQQIQLSKKPSKGTYLVKVYDENRVEIISDKVVIL